MEVSALDAPLRLASQNILISHGQNYPVDLVLRSLVINQSPRAKLRDRKEPRTGNVLVLGLLLDPSARDEGRQGKTREVVAREKPFASEVPIAVKIRLPDILHFREEFELGLRLPTELFRLFLVFLAPCYVHDDLSLGLDLLDGRKIQAAPAKKGMVECVGNLEKDRVQPLVRVPVGGGNFTLDGRENLLCPFLRPLPGNLVLDVRFY